MHKFQVSVNGQPIEVWVDTTNPNRSVEIEFSENVEEFKEWLSYQYGAFGHLIGDATSPIDLDYALTTPEAKQKYNPRLVGEGVVTSYDPDIPDGAVT